jgi:hypothetical protein
MSNPTVLIGNKLLNYCLSPLELCQYILAKEGRKIYDAENYPQNRNVVNVNRWQDSYMLMRADSTAQESSIKRGFRRHVKKLEEQDFIRSYDDNVWLVHD